MSLATHSGFTGDCQVTLIKPTATPASLKQNFQPDGHHQLQVEEMDTIHKEQMLGIGMDAQHWPKNS